MATIYGHNVSAVDTNVLVRLIIQDDPKQTGAAHLFVEQGVWASALVIAEAVWVLRSTYGRTASEIADIIEMLLDNKQLVIQDSDVVFAALELFRTRPALSFSDCLILQMARKNGHRPLGTFDRALGKCEGAQKL